MNKIIITAEDKGKRLDVFLTSQSDKSRSQIQKTIKAGLVLVNGKKAIVHQFLRENDTVEILNSESQILNEEAPKIKKEKTIDKIKKIFKKDKTNEPRIIFKAKDYIVIEKPAGLLVHAARGEKDTLVTWLLKNFPEVKKIQDATALIKNDETYRPGIMHRLDRNVSGVMLIARNQKSFDYFKSQFKQKEVQKEYVALINGELPDAEGVIEFEIGRKKSGEKMAAFPKGSWKGKEAKTIYEIEKRFVNYTLVKAMPVTGRTNQIRVHFFAIGYPIVGDMIYKQSDVNSKYSLDRVFLHAEKITFKDMDSNEQSFTAELPAELTDFLKNLKEK